MPRRITNQCDYPGCTATLEETRTAGNLIGWGRRQVVDHYRKLVAEGVREFHAQVTLYTCPRHLDRVHELPSPPLHPDVAEFARQTEDYVPR